MNEGRGSFPCLVVFFHSDLLKDEICFIGKMSPEVKGLLSVIKVGILSAFTANSVLCPSIRVLQCV